MRLEVRLGCWATLWPAPHTPTGMQAVAPAALWYVELSTQAWQTVSATVVAGVSTKVPGLHCEAVMHDVAVPAAG